MSAICRLDISPLPSSIRLEPPHAWLRRQRVDRARTLLRERELSLEMIAGCRVRQQGRHHFLPCVCVSTLPCSQRIPERAPTQHFILCLCRFAAEWESSRIGHALRACAVLSRRTCLPPLRLRPMEISIGGLTTIACFLPASGGSSERSD